jgi:hypothetical protein
VLRDGGLVASMPPAGRQRASAALPQTGGPTRAFTGIAPGEVEDLFEPAFRVEWVEAPTRSRHIATYLLERLETAHA